MTLDAIWSYVAADTWKDRDSFSTEDAEALFEEELRLVMDNSIEQQETLVRSVMPNATEERVQKIARLYAILGFRFMRKAAAAGYATNDLLAYVQGKLTAATARNN